MTCSKKHKKINFYHLKNDKNCVENRNNIKKKNCDYDAKRKSQSSTVDLRKQVYCCHDTKKLGEVDNTMVVLNKTFHDNLCIFQGLCMNFCF